MDNRTVRAAKLLNPALQLWRWSSHLNGWVRVENPKWYPWTIFSYSSGRNVRPP